jgi:hypothetical protein
MPAVGSADLKPSHHTRSHDWRSRRRSLALDAGGIPLSSHSHSVLFGERSNNHFGIGIVFIGHRGDERHQRPARKAVIHHPISIHHPVAHAAIHTPAHHRQLGAVVGVADHRRWVVGKNSGYRRKIADVAVDDAEHDGGLVVVFE